MQDKSDTKRRAGDQGEELAAVYLIRNRYRILARNYRIKQGEIDIIARRGGMLYFFEVKVRGCGSIIEALEAITPAKARRIRRAAEHYLMRNPALERLPCSFGVIGIDSSNQPPAIECILDAFE